MFYSCIIFHHFCQFYKQFVFSTESYPVEIKNPCVPSPCGANAVCREQNGAGSCSCIPDYYGNPYESCRPECTVNTDCPSNKACANNKCVNPCPGSCGPNAECQVISHVPSCTCSPGYTGDPFRYCTLIPPQAGNFDLSHTLSHYKSLIIVLLIL